MGIAPALDVRGHLIGFLRGLWAAILIATLCVSGVISFAAIVYSGPLVPFVQTGIGLALLGAALMSAIGGLFYTFRGTVCIPQDITAIVVAITTTHIATSWTPDDTAGLVPTIAMLVAVSTGVTGVTAYLFGRFRLGFLARFLPYPVLGGFLAATGYLLVAAGIGMCLGQTSAGHGLSDLFQPHILIRWLPWAFLALTLAVVAHRIRSALLLPAVLAGAAAAFYLVLHVLHVSLETAGSSGLLLGPFPTTGFVDLIKPSLVTEANWEIVLGQRTMFCAVALLAIVGTLLHATGLELALDREFDLERDLRATGIANIAGAFGGGLVGFQVMGGTTLGHKLGLGGILPGLSAAAGCIFTFLFGGAVLSVLPVGLFASLIILVGLDLLLTWLWFKRTQLSLADYGLVLLILVTTAVFGLFSALAVGVAVATAFFIVSFSRVDVIRLRSTLATRRSLTERSDRDAAVLARLGGQTAILELAGYLFFGTANSLLEKLRRELALPDAPKTLIVDFARVSGLDASVSHSLGKLSRVCDRLDVRLIFCGMSPLLLKTYLKGASDLNRASLCANLDAALEQEEARLLASCPPQAGSHPVDDQFDTPEEVASLLDKFGQLTLKKGEVLLREGEASTEMFVLLGGEMHAEIAAPNRDPIVVARFIPGAPIGEIAFLTASARTATVIADTDVSLLKIRAEMLAPEAENAEAAIQIHRYVATSLSRRLRNMTLLFRDAGL